MKASPSRNSNPTCGAAKLPQGSVNAGGYKQYIFPLLFFNGFLLCGTETAGVYGMNFRHMPELHQTWGYPAVLVLMLCMTVGMLLFFRRKKWL